MYIQVSRRDTTEYSIGTLLEILNRWFHAILFTNVYYLFPIYPFGYSSLLEGMGLTTKFPVKHAKDSPKH
jgi:hypothetical protein